ncbi:MAG: hypothetical protein KC729_20195, partial [Candidatus Eisenbacteria bacterium]|nr:hypothetical protein [Candidatus Eisenbacteria bacterium]
QYTDVVFATRTPTAAEILTGSRDTPPSSLEQRELEISLDLQLTAALTGQTSVVWSRTTADQIAGETREVPWSRRGYLRSWLVWRGGHGLSSTLSWSWDSGRPYDLCLIGRGCASWQRIRGRLPSQTQTDWAGAWETRFAGTDWELSLEIHNVLDQRPPSYDFSAFPMGITADNFLAYWDETGETDGYLIDNGNARVARGVHNPQTRVLGRTMLAAVGVRF